MSKVDTGSPEFISDVESAALQVADRLLKEERDRQKRTRRPSLRPVRKGERRQLNTIERFDGRTGLAELDSQVCEMWTLDVHEKNGVRYGVTQTVHGLKSIRKSMRPTLDTDGMIVRPGWLPVDRDLAEELSESLGLRGVPAHMPEDLRITPEMRKELDAPRRKGRNLPDGFVADKRGTEPAFDSPEAGANVA